MLLRSLVFLSVFAICFGSMAIGPLQPKPAKYANIEGCYIEELDEVVPFGKSAPAKGNCLEYRCRTNNVVYASCGVIQVQGEGGHLVEDKGKPYPDCCPRVVPS